MSPPCHDSAVSIQKIPIAGDKMKKIMKIQAECLNTTYKYQY